MNGELSIIVPVYNEARTLREIMQRISDACPEAQIVYVDDGSQDNSLKILQESAREEDVVRTKQNGGKGSAIREGLLYAKNSYTVIQDADLEYDPAQILTLLDHAKKHPGCAVFGSRFLTQNPNLYKRFLFGNKLVTGMLNILFFAHLTDSYTCYKLLPTDVFRSLNLRSNGFELEAEISSKCLRKRIPILEVPIAYKPRTIEEGKKINWKDAVKGILMMIKIRLGMY